MPPILALIICILFVLFLINLERKQNPEASIALWLPTIWILLILSKPLGVWFGFSGESMEEGSPLDRYLLLGIFLLGLIILMRRKFNWIRIIKINPFLLLLIGFMLASIIWSDSTYVSFKRWTREFVAIIMGSILATEKEPYEAVQSIFRRAIYVLIPISYVLIHYYSQFGREYGRWSGLVMWVGASTQKNGLALLCLLSILFFVWTFIYRRKNHKTPAVWYQIYVEVLIFILAVWIFMGPTHTLTNSATSTATLAIVIMVLLIIQRYKTLLDANTLTVIIGIIIIFGTAIPFNIELMPSNVSILLNRNETLTGRTEIWAYLVPYAMSNPIIGHGFGGFWTDEHREASSSNAHNGYLDIILDTGIIGLVLFAMFWIYCCRMSAKLISQDYGLGHLWVCVLIAGVLHNITESSLTSFTNILGAANLFILLSVASNLEKQKSDVK